ncbi:GNAT family N-acetyltransferase [Rhizobiaceae bacterium BDR2-2]|uniref:GNAT family N-acetyltransferase n=1 Tax=Ectorhizobium quercum TaxID=2965071 RepID=A0AAE3MWJ9_9HYPH|nr:GNAT family N-acetyltransferase [Ectorhizobium quercum]MCX8996603.1 GNAT family N-acetyltransferase [Ectorhizobium quercum]
MPEPELLADADEAAEDAVYSALRAYNIDRFGPSDQKPLQIVLRDGEGNVIGGLTGETARGWLFVKLLYVPEACRGRGLATRLLALAEEEARKRGCTGMQIDTMNPDALRLYRRYGFEIAGTLGALKGGHTLTWLANRIDGAQS